MNNPKIVSPEKTGKDHFAYSNEMKQPKSRQIDDQFIDQQYRNTSGYPILSLFNFPYSVYLPRKGHSKCQQQVDQMKSSITGVIKSEDNKGKQYSEFVKPVSQKDRVSSDIIGWSQNPGQSEKGGMQIGKKKANEHPAVQTNGDFIKWQ